MPSTLGAVPLKPGTFSTWICLPRSQVPRILNGPLPIGASPKPGASEPSGPKAAFGRG
jgi:hypothetical protein